MYQGSHNDGRTKQQYLELAQITYAIRYFYSHFCKYRLSLPVLGLAANQTAGDLATHSTATWEGSVYGASCPAAPLTYHVL